MKLPRIMLAAPRSGSGKTMLTCGILQALLNRKKNPASFKCGPDYIDPMFHSRVLGIPAGNLDTFFTEERVTRALFGKRAERADLSVIEGVMGFYDGMGLTSERSSSYELAKVLEAPVVLIVDGKGMSLSVAAEIKGFLEYRKDAGIKGVILNRVSEGVFSALKDPLEQELGVKMLGYVPMLPEAAVESRHLGLVTPAEIADFKERVQCLAAQIEKSVDLDGLFALAEGAAAFSFSEPEVPVLKKPVRIGVARDEAFCFYYRENLELLEKMGAELIFFSPLHDKKVPDGLHGMLFGGGYPELHAEQLSANKSMLAEIRSACGRIPYLAECGGFLYLCRKLTDVSGKTYEMAGVIAADGAYQKKLQRFGYIELTGKRDTVFGKAGVKLKGHEFHYFDTTDNGDAFAAKKPLRDQAWACIHAGERMAAGFPHLYYDSDPQAVFHYLERCAETEKNSFLDKTGAGTLK